MAGIAFVTEPPVVTDRVELLSPLVRRVVAANPGPLTYHGTCSYIVGRGTVGVIDPGPADSAHVDAILASLEPGEEVTHILATHTHSDHSPASRPLGERTGAAICGYGRQERVSDPDTTRVVFSGLDDPPKPVPTRFGDQEFEPQVVLRGGDTVEGDGWTLEAVHTPGHASNHLCYSLVEEATLFTGDHVLGWATSVVAAPDGDVSEYLNSLERLLARDDRCYLPGHGPKVDQPRQLVEAFIAHRLERDEQILARLASGPATIAEMVAAIYAGYPSKLWPAAAASVHAHLLRLNGMGLVEPIEPPLRRNGIFRLYASTAE